MDIRAAPWRNVLMRRENCPTGSRMDVGGAAISQRHARMLGLQIATVSGVERSYTARDLFLRLADKHLISEPKRSEACVLH
jgi:hypothetical protein